MKNFKLLAVALLISVFSMDAPCQVPQDFIPSEKGPIRIIPIQHASLVITWSDQVIYIDPYGGAQLYNDLPQPNMILITDIHGDHMNIETLEALNVQEIPIYAPPAVIQQLPSTFTTTSSISNSEVQSVGEILIEAIPMYNLPQSDESRHPKGRGNGYVLTISGKRIYVSGDTEDIIEMRQLANIDVAFVCMNLPYTMDVESAASAVLDFKPKIVYPFHYRGKGGFSDIVKFKHIVESKNFDIDVRIRDWYAE